MGPCAVAGHRFRNVHRLGRPRVHVNVQEPDSECIRRMSLIDPIPHSVFPDTQATDRRESSTKSRSPSRLRLRPPSFRLNSISQARAYKRCPIILISLLEMPLPQHVPGSGRRSRRSITCPRKTGTIRKKNYTSRLWAAWLVVWAQCSVGEYVRGLVIFMACHSLYQSSMSPAGFYSPRCRRL